MRRGCRCVKFPCGGILLLLVSLSGCGYHLGWKAPPKIRTIAVPTFQNHTFPLRREIELELTSALRQEILARTPLQLVSEHHADMVVYGTVSEFHERVVAEGRRDRKIESNIRVAVDLRIEDYRNRKSWSLNVDDVEPFSIQRGETIQVARRRAIGNLAEKMLLALEIW